MVVVGGRGGAAEVGGSSWRSRTKMFVCSRCACEFPANAARSVKEKDVAYAKLLCNIKAEFVSHHFPCVFMYKL